MKKYTKKDWTFENISCFIVAKYRSFCYYNGLRFLLRKSIINVFLKRLTMLPEDCYYNSGCKRTSCECDIPDILFCKKACEGGCYPHYNLMK